MKTKNLPERFVLHPRHIAQGHYILSVTANRLLKTAMLHFDWEHPKTTVKFSFSEYFKLWGIEHPGAEDKRLLKQAVQELLHASVEIKEDYLDGSFGYVGYNFLSSISAFLTSWGLDEVKITFTPEIATALAEYQKSGYCLLDPEKLKQLDGKYDFRFYEIAMSHVGQKKNGQWWFEYSIEDLREVLQTGKKYNTSPKDFRTWVVDKSIMAINDADIGLHISVQRPKRMTEKDKLHFICKYASQSRHFGQKANQAIKINDEPPAVSKERLAMEEASIKIQQENEHLKQAFPEKYQQFLEEIQKEHTTSPFWLEMESEKRQESESIAAANRLRAAYPDFFKNKAG